VTSGAAAGDPYPRSALSRAACSPPGDGRERRRHHHSGVHYASGRGVLIDVDGNSLIDFDSGIAVGSAAGRVVANVRQQAGEFTHCCFMVTPTRAMAVCKELARLTPGGHEKRSALFNSGAETVENTRSRLPAPTPTGRP
jgi:4-aminobutyrate aminotransferase/(S)-3-amino-2-methylpropionate transaminase